MFESKEISNYIKDLGQKILDLYSLEEIIDDKDDELKKFYDLIKIDDYDNFEHAFENQLYYLMQKEGDKRIFNFRIKNKESQIIWKIYDYLTSNKIKIMKPKLSKEEKKKIKQEKQAESRINLETNNKTVDIDKKTLTKITKEIGPEKSSEGDINCKTNISNENNINIDSQSNSKTNSKSINSGLLFSCFENSKLDKDSFLSSKNKTEVPAPKAEEQSNKEKKDKSNNVQQNQIKEINVEDLRYKEKNSIKFYEDTNNVAGTVFEYDTINYIFKHLYSISKNKDFSVIYNWSPDKGKINSIFSKYSLYEIEQIQFDFLIKNIHINDLLQLLIDFYPGIHSGSKISLAYKNKSIISFDDLLKIKESNLNNGETFDLIGEVGVNIYNEDEKCLQLIKYAKLLHNLNQLIKRNAPELPNLLQMLNMHKHNKKILVFITDGSFSKFTDIKTNTFLTLQNKLNFDCLLFYRNQNKLYRTVFLIKLFKKYKKEQIKLFELFLDDQFKKVIQSHLKAFEYEPVVKKLSAIEKKIYNIKEEFYLFLKDQNNFKDSCQIILESIKRNEKVGVSKKSFEKIKIKFFKDFFQMVVEPKIKVYVAYDYIDKNTTEVINELSKHNIQYKEGRDISKIIDYKNDIFKIFIFFVGNELANVLQMVTNLVRFNNNGIINRLSPIVFYVENKDSKNTININLSYLKLNIEYADKNNINNITKEICGGRYKKKSYYLNIDLVREEILYKFILKYYIDLFNKTLFCDKETNDNYNLNKKELIFKKLGQDIQFFGSFDIDPIVSLQKETKESFENIIKSKEIDELITNFVDNSTTIKEIQNVLKEFEKSIEKRKSIIENKNKKSTDIKDDKQLLKTSNIIIDIKEEKTINLIVDNNSYRQQKKQIDECMSILKKKGISKSNDNENIIKKSSKNIDNNTSKDDGSKNNDKKNITEISSEGVDKNTNKEENSSNNDEINIGDKSSKNNDKKENDKEDKNNVFFVLMENIKNNFKDKLKDEIYFIIYNVLRKSLVHLFESKFIESYFSDNE